MRLALYASVGAAVLSASVALYVVFRDDHGAERPGLLPVASAASVDRETTTAAPTEPDVGGPAADTALSDAPGASLAWPDLEIEELPPTGAAPPELGQSVGSPRDGALLSPTQLSNGRDYVIRNESTVWGTRNTVEHLAKAIETMRSQHPAVHRVVVGDISTRRGGPLPGHTSHQSGRDVDVGLVMRGRAEDAPAEFVEATRDNLDRRATYDLIEALAATRDDPTGVELIVLDYNLQRLLRRAAAARGVPEETLEALFQFPHGPESRHGLVRHMPAHRDHIHVRFRCPEDDRYCREPLIGFAGMEAAEPTDHGPD
ncbi:MAG: penicillin-insensitive murein endopeptidase [Myxococcales bacterium]|nr:penicillin-insensitive murein endopeptidase [Myxococcales bacterium]